MNDTNLKNFLTKKIPNPFIEPILINNNFVQLDFIKLNQMLESLDVFLHDKEFFFDTAILKKIAYSILNINLETPVYFDIDHDKIVVKNFLHYCSLIFLSKPITFQKLSHHSYIEDVNLFSFVFKDENCLNYHTSNFSNLNKFIEKNNTFSQQSSFFTWDNPQETKKTTKEAIFQSFQFLQTKQQNQFSLIFLELWFNSIDPIYQNSPQFLKDLFSIFENIHFEANTLSIFFSEHKFLNKKNAQIIIDSKDLNSLKLLLTLNINLFQKKDFFDLCSQLTHTKSNMLELLDYSLLINRYDRQKIIPIFFNSNLPLFLQIDRDILIKLKERLIDHTNYINENSDYTLLNTLSSQAKKIIINDKSLFFSIFIPNELMIEHLASYKTKNSWLNNPTFVLELFQLAHDKHPEQSFSKMYPLIENLPKNVVSDVSFLTKLLEIKSSYYLFLKKFWPKHFKKIPLHIQKTYFLDFFKNNKYIFDSVIAYETLEWISINEIKPLLNNSSYSSIIFEHIKKHPKYSHKLEHLLYLFNDCSNLDIEKHLSLMIIQKIKTKQDALKYCQFHLVYQNLPDYLKDDIDLTFSYIIKSQLNLSKIKTKFFYNKQFCLNTVGLRLELPKMIPESFWYDKEFSFAFFEKLYHQKILIQSLSFFPEFIKHFFNPLERQLSNLTDDDYFKFLSTQIYYLELTINTNHETKHNIKQKIKKI